MKDRLKLVLLLVVFAAAAIVIVLGSWLYGSYYQRMDLFRATAEQSLFEAVQDVAQEMQEGYPEAEKSMMHPPWSTELMETVRKAFPASTARQLEHLADSLFEKHRQDFEQEMPRSPQPDRADEGRERSAKPFSHAGNPMRRPHILPFRLMHGAVPTDTLVQKIEDRFDTFMQRGGLHASYTVSVGTLDPEERFPLGPGASAQTQELSLRPLLIDPQHGQFLKVHFDQPWQFLLFSMSWQLVVSVFILAVVVGTFVYLFITIIRQNRLDVLRKAFVNSLTHELRTPVTTVYVAVEALHDYIDVQDRALREQYHVMAIEELDHLSAMIDRVLDIADGDAKDGRMLATESLDFAALVEKSVSHMQLVHAEQGTLINLARPHQPVYLEGDPHHLKNIVNNLLDNALKYGGQRIDVQIVDDDTSGAIMLRIADDGIGIPAAYQQQVFEPFFRVPRGDLYTVKGFGLGLPYVKRIVQQHGGHIKLKSAKGQGTTFIIKLPKQER